LRLLKGKHKLYDINHFILRNMNSEAFATAGLPIFPVAPLVDAAALPSYSAQPNTSVMRAELGRSTPKF
jgi:hypothetical protein